MKINRYSILSKATAIAGLLFASVGAANAQLPTQIDCNGGTTVSGNCGGANNGYIRSVETTGGINNISNMNTNCGNTLTGYSDYTTGSEVVTQDAGKQVTVKVTWVGNPGAQFGTAWIRIWVDWNRNGTFTQTSDVDEFITLTGGSTSYHLNSGGTLNYVITVPGHAKQGKTRMRIAASALSLNTPNPGVNNCGMTGGIGEAEDYTFEVINPCVPPNVISVSNLDYKSGDFSWTKKLNAEFYEYIITPADTIPHDTVIGFTFTTNNSVDVDTFQCDTKYYILVRVICDTTGKQQSIYWDKSAWIRDSFTTQPCCYDPQVTVDKITHNTARASWAPVATALGYEYAASTLTTPPQKGTYTINNSVLLQGLSSKVTYFVYVRTRCTPTPLSDWTQTAFKTLGTTSVDELNGEDFYIQAYPSPVTDVLNVNITGEISKNAKITLIDLSGKVVYTAPVTTAKVSIDASGFASGIYVVKYTDDIHNKIMRVTK